MHDNIFRIAQLIRQRPGISAQAVARALGYAESKSVYYWLRKIGYTFSEFKAAVLSGVFPSGEVLAESRAVYGGGTPVAERIGANGAPIMGSETAPFLWPRSAFALHWETDAYAPEINRGDWLVIASGAVTRPRWVLLVDDEGHPAVGRLIEGARDPTVVEVGFGRTWTAPLPPMAGSVAALVRPL